MPLRQIERFPRHSYTFVCEAAFALDLIKNKHTYPHTRRSQAGRGGGVSWQTCTEIREGARETERGIKMKGKREAKLRWRERERERMGLCVPNEDFLALFTFPTKIGLVFIPV